MKAWLAGARQVPSLAELKRIPWVGQDRGPIPWTPRPTPQGRRGVLGGFQRALGVEGPVPPAGPWVPQGPRPVPPAGLWVPQGPRGVPPAGPQVPAKANPHQAPPVCWPARFPAVPLAAEKKRNRRVERASEKYRAGQCAMPVAAGSPRACQMAVLPLGHHRRVAAVALPWVANGGVPQVSCPPGSARPAGPAGPVGAFRKPRCIARRPRHTPPRPQRLTRPGPGGGKVGCGAGWNNRRCGSAVSAAAVGRGVPTQERVAGPGPPATQRPMLGPAQALRLAPHHRPPSL